jgi:hypothetical protein
MMRRRRGHTLGVMMVRNGAMGAEGMTDMFGAHDFTGLARNGGRAKHKRKSERHQALCHG